MSASVPSVHIGASRLCADCAWSYEVWKCCLNLTITNPVTGDEEKVDESALGRRIVPHLCGREGRFWRFKPRGSAVCVGGPGG